MWSWQEISEYMMEIHLVSTLFKLALALLCGGILGIERGRKKRPAGFRTYMLVSVGATLVMATNQYMINLYPAADPARLGAQVISGIGFLGAGTIIVTGRNRVRGLTTAAGLWASACVGLAIGIGFYSGAIIGCIMIYIVMALLQSLDNWVMSSTKTMELYIEFRKMSDIGAFINYAKEHEMKLSDLEMTKSNNMEEPGVAMLLTLRMKQKMPHTEIIHMLSMAEGVRFVEEV